MNVKLHTPKTLKAGSGIATLKQFVLSMVATTILFCVAIIDANAQYFSAQTPYDQWRDSLKHSIRLKPIVGLNYRYVPHFRNESNHSVVLRNRPVEQPINPVSIQVGRFVAYDPAPIFQYNYYHYDEDQTIIGALLNTFVDILIDNSSKPKPKPRKKTIDY